MRKTGQSAERVTAILLEVMRVMTVSVVDDTYHSCHESVIVHRLCGATNGSR
jgi:hypothetical protein